MTPRFFVTVEAANELAEAVEWYAARQPGLGSELLNAFRDAVSLVARNPDLFAPVSGEIRRVLMRRFPYGVYYAIEPGECVVVLGVEHHRRRPRRWPR